MPFFAISSSSVLSCLAGPSQVAQGLVRGVVAGRPRDPASGVRSRAAEVKAGEGRAVARKARDRPHEEELLEGEVPVEDVAFREAVGPLEVEGSEDLAGQDRALHV